MVRFSSIIGMLFACLFSLSEARALELSCAQYNTEHGALTQVVFEDRHTIDVMGENLEMICDGVDHVRNWFFTNPHAAQMPNEWKVVARFSPINVVVRDEVVLHTFQDHPPVRVYAVFDGTTDTVSVSTWGTDYLKPGSREAFRIPVSKELHTSVVAHEIAHSIMHRITSRKSPPAHAEGWAYMIQLSVLNSDLRERILSKYTNREKHFEGILQFNSMLASAIPHQFGVMAYNWWIDNGPDHHFSMMNGTAIDPLEGIPNY